MKKLFLVVLTLCFVVCLAQAVTRANRNASVLTDGWSQNPTPTCPPSGCTGSGGNKPPRARRR